MSNVKGVILDFNGTLFFDSSYHELAWKAISKELRGTEMSDEELRDHMHGNNNEKVINYIMGKNIDESENKKYSLKKEEMYRKMCIENPDEFHLAPGVECFLSELVKKNIPFTIASASIKENIDFFVEKFHLEQWLDTSLIVYDDGSYPTKVEMFKEASSRIHVPIEDCMIIEDSTSGIKFAHESGAQSIVAVATSDDREKFEPFFYLNRIVQDFREFPWELIK